MSTEDKEGSYCATCGGISPGKVKTKQITVNGKDVGINELNEIIAEVKALQLDNDEAITERLLTLTKKHNYVPTSRVKHYGEALLREYKREG